MWHSETWFSDEYGSVRLMVELNLRSLSHLNESMIQWKVVYVLSVPLWFWRA